MFTTILIANRGEIACRVIRTARRLGIRTIAVYSDADIRALHVEMADEAWRIGPAPVAESYLNIGRIVEVARLAGAQAIHPGYGFLSENPSFVEAVEAAGLTFIGPTADAIRAMGLKDAAKALMEKAGVPVVPGYHGQDQDPDTLAAHAGRIGYPLLIKARAGGGGKGMRRVDDPAGFFDALGSAKREATAAFGDGHVLLETYVRKPRHVEIQVFGDRFGDAIHLFERDCSLQRRHQKVIEEAPAPGMTESMRAAMGEAAVRAAKAIGYQGAGTIEFIADVTDGLREDRFFFMEMNTRLQVEHPVTEAITGQDLVEWQIRVAAGEPLPLRQDELAIDGWAVEARVYAEDAARGFLPATGRLETLRLPEHTVRVDAGVRAGDLITPFYDPMIAKMIAHGSTREAALGRLGAALSDARIAGTVTNLAFLARLCAEPGFASGDVDTGLIDRSLARLTEAVEPPPEAVAAAALSSLGVLAPPVTGDPWSSLPGWRLWSEASQFAVLEFADARHEVRVVTKGTDRYAVDIAGDAVGVAVLARDAQSARLAFGERVLAIEIARSPAALTVFLDGIGHVFGLPDALAGEDEGEAAGDQVTAPMPGVVTLVAVKPGGVVAKGETLIVMEAMKMEMRLTAPRDGVVDAVTAAKGEQVAEGTVLITLVTEDAG
ncbi:ATP-binding protein [Marinivivus vitaminiproducens]|uniref:ATP-binding protein n=1 Tax=Marinivivus vitaminiproducens TaxID=3035935 RepID=UPI0027A69193|nr:acetyl/propionyl/methylcrotonyl-CoA carboxylase subunit alpha [Geminicoccaceae bacterium SCSIO 64248]